MIKSFFENIEIEICREIETCKNKIDIAVAWLTNYGIMNLLRIKAEQDDIEIRIIINDDKINNIQINQYRALLNSGIKIFKYGDTNLMHNKFAVLDSTIVITGSYNWTRAAQNNLENIVITNNADLAIKYQSEFQRLLNKSIEIDSTKTRESTNKYLEQFNEESIWEILNQFHSIKFNPSVYRIYYTICGTKSGIAKYTKGLQFYNTISNYKSPKKVLSDLKLFFENHEKIIKEQFKYEERGWNKIDFPGAYKYNLLHNNEINILESTVVSNLNAGKKWTSSELNILSRFILKTNNTLFLSKLLNRSEKSIIKKSKRMLYENKSLYEQWNKLLTTTNTQGFERHAAPGNVP